MKIPIAVTLVSLFAVINLASAQQAAPKPPVGIPADAKLFNGKWYRVYLERLPFDRARQKCVALGGQLAMVPDEPTWAFLKGHLRTITWLGGTDEKTDGVWLWTDGTAFTFKGWSRGQPDNTGGNENYVSATSEGWNDVPKSGNFGDFHVSAFMCEWKDRR